MIHIGVDAWNLIDNPRGTGRYTREILAAWQRSFSDRVRVTLVVPESFSFLYARRYRAAAGGITVRVRSRARPGRFDAWWFPFNGPSWERWSGRSVATRHDASLFFTHANEPAALAPMRRAVARCDGLVTDSVFAAHELAREFAEPLERFIPITLGVAPLACSAVTIDPAQYGRFVLYVGGTEPRKDLPTMLAAMRIVQAAMPDVGFVLIGPQTFALPEHEGVRLDVLGIVDEPTLAAFFRACAAFMYASTYEGFGLPVLEAQSYGAPVVAADSSSLPEAGGTAALYAPPGDAQAFAAHLLRILRDPAVAARTRERGRAHAANNTWERTAQSLLRVFEDVVAR
ncbi:MAG: hypothetical protein NVSMB5_11420 [Candidatus Velthaea sp.]